MGCAPWSRYPLKILPSLAHQHVARRTFEKGKGHAAEQRESRTPSAVSAEDEQIRLPGADFVFDYVKRATLLYETGDRLRLSADGTENGCHLLLDHACKAGVPFALDFVAGALWGQKRR